MIFEANTKTMRLSLQPAMQLHSRQLASIINLVVARQAHAYCLTSIRLNEMQSRCCKLSLIHI